MVNLQRNWLSPFPALFYRYFWLVTRLNSSVKKFSHECHMTITWLSQYSHNMIITWLITSDHMTVIIQKFSHDCHMIVMWLTWQSHDNHMTVSIQSHDSHDNHMTYHISITWLSLASALPGNETRQSHDPHMAYLIGDHAELSAIIRTLNNCSVYGN